MPPSRHFQHLRPILVQNEKDPGEEDSGFPSTRSPSEFSYGSRTHSLYSTRSMYSTRSHSPHRVVHAFRDPSEMLRAVRETPPVAIKRVSMTNESLETVKRKNQEKVRNAAMENIHRKNPINEVLATPEEDEATATKEQRIRRISAKATVIAHMKNRMEGISSSIAVTEDNYQEHLGNARKSKWDLENFKDLMEMHCIDTKRRTNSDLSLGQPSPHCASRERTAKKTRRESTMELDSEEIPDGFVAPAGHSPQNRHRPPPSEETSGAPGKWADTAETPKWECVEEGMRSQSVSQIDLDSKVNPGKPEPIACTPSTQCLSPLVSPSHNITEENTKTRSRSISSLEAGIERNKKAFKSQRHMTMQMRNIFSRKNNTQYGIHDHDLQTKTLLLLLALGTLAGSIEYCVNTLVNSFQEAILLARSLVDGFGADFGVFVSMSLVLASASAAITHWFDPVVSPGGGISVMKYIIGSNSVKPIHFWLKTRSLIVKFFGLAFAASSPGLSVGREGPFVHMASILANQLMLRVPYFTKIHNSSSLRTQIFSSACAVGVASAFTAPIGGVLFSIEVTRTYYLLSNYWKAFAASVAGFVLVRLLSIWVAGTENATSPFFPLIGDDGSGTYGPGDFFETVQLIFITLLASLMGIMGPVYIKALTSTKKYLGRIAKKRPQLYIFLAVLFQASVFYVCGPFFRIPMKSSIIDLLKFEDLPEDHWGKSLPQVLGNLWLYFMVRVVFTLISVSLPLPVGDFMPLFAAGAAFGRFFGMAVGALFPSLRVLPSVYALCGAAAIVGSTTQTFSTAVIALEFTWLFQFQMQILISVFVAVIICRQYSVSIYDATLELRGMKSLPPLRHEAAFQLQAKDIMVTKPKLLFVPVRTNYAQILKLLKTSTHLAYPVVNSEHEMIFLGCVARKQLKRHLFHYFKKNDALCELLHELPGEFEEILQMHRTDEKKPSNKLKLYYPAPLDLWMQKKLDSPGRRRKRKRRTLDSLKSTGSEASLRDWGRTIITVRNILPQKKVKVSVTQDLFPHQDHCPALLPRLLDAAFDMQTAPEITVDPSAFTIPEFMSAEQIHVLFEMLRCKRVFIASFDGTLVGVIDHQIFASAINKSSKEN